MSNFSLEITFQPKSEKDTVIGLYGSEDFSKSVMRNTLYNKCEIDPHSQFLLLAFQSCTEVIILHPHITETLKSVKKQHTRDNNIPDPIKQPETTTIFN
jgi:hypothetical protein